MIAVRRTLSLIAAMPFVHAAGAQQAETPPRVERVDALFAPWDRPDSPGCALGVAARVLEGRLGPK